MKSILTFLLAAVAMLAAFLLSPGHPPGGGLEAWCLAPLALGMIINRDNIIQLNTGFRVIHNREYSGYDPVVNQLALETTSDGPREVLSWLSDFGGMKEHTGGKMTAGNFAESNWTVNNRKWYDLKELDADAVKDDKYGEFNVKIRHMGERAAWHPDKLLSELLLAGFTELDYTGSAFFADSKKHVANAPALTFDNKMTTQLTAATFAEARRKLSVITGPDGYPIHPKLDLLLVTSPQLTADALKIVEAVEVSSTTNVWKGKATHLEFPFLGSSANWFLINRAGTVRPFINQVRERTQFFSMTDPLNSEVFYSDKYAYKSQGRYNITYGMPQCIVGSTGADAP